MANSIPYFKLFESSAFEISELLDILGRSEKVNKVIKDVCSMHVHVPVLSNNVGVGLYIYVGGNYIYLYLVYILTYMSIET